MTLKRKCLGCKRPITRGSRCRGCQAEHDHAKEAHRPERKTAAEIRRRRQAVADHRARFGDWCPGVPGYRAAHPAANLSADHVIEVAAGGDEGGPLVVRCVPCNSARSANVRRLVPPTRPAAAPPRHPNFATHTTERDRR